MATTQSDTRGPDFGDDVYALPSPQAHCVSVDDCPRLSLGDDSGHPYPFSGFTGYRTPAADSEDMPRSHRPARLSASEGRSGEASPLLLPFLSSSRRDSSRRSSRSMSSHDILIKIQELEVSRQTKLYVAGDRSGFLTEVAKQEDELAELVRLKVGRCQHLHFLENARTARRIEEPHHPAGTHRSQRIATLLGRRVDDESSSSELDDSPAGVRLQITQVMMREAAEAVMEQASRGGPSRGSVAFELGVQLVEHTMWEAHWKNEALNTPTLITSRAANEAAPRQHMLTPTELKAKRAEYAELTLQLRKAVRLQSNGRVVVATDGTGTVESEKASTSAMQQLKRESSPRIFQAQHCGSLNPLLTHSLPPSTFRRAAPFTSPMSPPFLSPQTTERRSRKRGILPPPSAAVVAGQCLGWEELDLAHVALVKYRNILEDLEREEADSEKDRIRSTGPPIVEETVSHRKERGTSRRPTHEHSRHRHRNKGPLNSKETDAMASLAEESVMGESFFKSSSHTEELPLPSSMPHADDDDDNLEDSFDNNGLMEEASEGMDVSDSLTPPRGASPLWYQQHVVDGKAFLMDLQRSKQERERSKMRVRTPSRRPASASLLRGESRSAPLKLSGRDHRQSATGYKTSRASDRRLSASMLTVLTSSSDEDDGNGGDVDGMQLSSSAVTTSSVSPKGPRPTSTGYPPLPIAVPSLTQARLQERGRLPPMRGLHLDSHMQQATAVREQRRNSTSVRGVYGSPTDHPERTPMHKWRAPQKITRPWSADGRVTSVYWQNWSAMKKREELERECDAIERASSSTLLQVDSSSPRTAAGGRPSSRGRLNGNPPRPATTSSRVSLNPSRASVIAGQQGVSLLRSIRLTEDEKCGQHPTGRSAALPPRPYSSGSPHQSAINKSVRFNVHGTSGNLRPSTTGDLGHCVPPPSLVDRGSSDVPPLSTTAFPAGQYESLPLDNIDGEEMSGLMRTSAFMDTDYYPFPTDDNANRPQSARELSIASHPASDLSRPVSQSDGTRPPRTAPQRPLHQSRFELKRRLPTRVSSAPPNRDTVEDGGCETRPATVSQTTQTRPSSAAAVMTAACRLKLQELESMPLSHLRAHEKASNSCQLGEAPLLHPSTIEPREVVYTQLLYSVKRDRDAFVALYRPPNEIDSQGRLIPRTHHSALKSKALELGLDCLRLGVELTLLKREEALCTQGRDKGGNLSSLKDESKAQSEFLERCELVLRTGRISIHHRPTSRDADGHVCDPSSVHTCGREGQPTQPGNADVLPVPSISERQDYALIRSYAHNNTPNVFLRSPAQLKALAAIPAPRFLNESSGEEDSFKRLVEQFVIEECHDELLVDASPAQINKHTNPILKHLAAAVAEAEGRYLAALDLVSESSLNLKHRSATTIQRAFRQWLDSSWSDHSQGNAMAESSSTCSSSMNRQDDDMQGG